MAYKFDIRLNDILLSLSQALDLITMPIGGVSEHGQRVCYIASNLAELLGYQESQMQEVFMATLLHDAGIYSELTATKLIEIDWGGSWEHCEEGYQLLRRFPRFENIANIIRHLPEKLHQLRLKKSAGKADHVVYEVFTLSQDVELLFYYYLYPVGQKDNLAGQRNLLSR